MDKKINLKQSLSCVGAVCTQVPTAANFDQESYRDGSDMNPLTSLVSKKMDTLQIRFNSNCLMLLLSPLCPLLVSSSLCLRLISPSSPAPPRVGLLLSSWTDFVLWLGIGAAIRLNLISASRRVQCITWLRLFCYAQYYLGLICASSPAILTFSQHFESPTSINILCKKSPRVSILRSNECTICYARR